MLQRARLHHHLPALLETIERWEANQADVWEVVELVERLRAQHVFPMALLRLADHEWEAMLGDVAGTENEHFPADQ